MLGYVRLSSTHARTTCCNEESDYDPDDQTENGLKAIFCPNFQLYPRILSDSPVDTVVILPEHPAFQVLEKIYASERSMVWRALRQSDQRRVLLKSCLNPEPNPQEARRFEAEFKLLSGLSCPGVNRVYALEHFGQRPVLVLEDLGGPSLEQALARTRLPLVVSLLIGLQLLEILACIHHAGIVHKDLNPANIVLDAHTRQWKLVDFSIATHAGQTEPETHSLEGTLSHLSPEQTGRVNRPVDYRSDYYSLGITLYQMLTGVLPFAVHEAMEAIHAHITHVPQAPNQLRADIPDALSELTLKLLEKNAEQRYQDAASLREDLEACLASLPAGPFSEEAARFEETLLKSERQAHSPMAEPKGRTTRPSTFSGTSGFLDLKSVLKAAQALSGEIILENLIQKLMTILLENAGAQSGSLLLFSDGELRIEARKSLDAESVEVLQSLPPTVELLPLSVLNYVRETHQEVVLGDTETHAMFASDPYVLAQRPQSLLCMPIERGGAPVGYLFLENALAKDAFTPDRLEVLTILCSQAAIALENARLYEHLEDKVLARTQELQTEIEERLRIEQHLIRERALLHCLIDSIPEPIFYKDLEGRYMGCNQKWATIFGRSIEAIVGHTDFELLPSVMAAEFERQDKLMIAEQIPRRSEEWVDYKDGSQRRLLLETIKTPYYDPDGRILGLIGYCRDITAQKQMEDSLREAQAFAEGANQAKSEFLANMSHELRTPLNSILGYAQILMRDGSLGDKQRNSILTVQKSGEHLLGLINDILDLAKVEAGKLELYPNDFDLDSFLGAIDKLFKVRAQEKGLAYRQDVEQALPAALHADEKKLRQILINLIGNALKFTDQGEVLLQISRQDNHFRFSIRDTGVGISADDQTQLFQAFQQVGDRSRMASGSGLGLSITARLVELMGGKLELESRPGQGSHFCFALELPPASEALVAGAHLDRKILGYAGAPRRLLIVDDKLENRRVLWDLLQTFGFELAEACDGAEAVEQTRIWQPALIFMDIRMPNMDGLEATRRIRQWDPEVVILAVTASVFQSDRDKCLDAGCNSFVTKPFQVRDLLAEIHRFLKLEWRYDPSVEAVEAPEGSALPSAEVLSELFELALQGEIVGIKKLVKRLLTDDPGATSFYQQIQNLAASFKVQAIREYLKPHLQSDPFHSKKG